MDFGRWSLLARDYPQVHISTYRCSNRLELVLCEVDNPLYSVYVTVPVCTLSEILLSSPHPLLLTGVILLPKVDPLSRR